MANDIDKPKTRAIKPFALSCNALDTIIGSIGNTQGDSVLKIPANNARKKSIILPY